jgi:hypothetical protein
VTLCVGLATIVKLTLIPRAAVFLAGGGRAHAVATIP